MTGVGERVGDYTVVRQLHDGVYGNRFEARPPARLGHSADTVALKVANRNANADVFSRFSNEMRLLHRVDSVHLNPLLDAGTWRGRLFYATPMFHNGSIGSEGRTMQPDELVTAVADAARGAHELHELGVAHRDIKPSNVLLRPDGRGVLTELGLAQFLDQHSITRAGAPIGSLHFLAPQILWGQKASRHTDIWALAQVAHVTLTGVSTRGELAPEANLLDTLRHLANAEPRIDHRCPRHLQPVIERAHEVGGATPYRDAQAFADGLESAIKGV